MRGALMRKFLAFIYAVILLTVSQCPTFGQAFNYSQIKDYNTDNTANVTNGNALQVDITSSSGTANTNLYQVGGSSTATGNGIAGVGGVQRVTLASDGTGHVIFWDGTNTASVSAAGAVKVDGSAVTQPVSISGSVPVTGTFWQATQPVSGTFFQATQPVSVAATVAVDGSGHIIPVSQSGTWNIGSLTSITNPVAVTGTFWQATQPVSAASLPLPTGASTSAKQPSLGTAGSASTDVISVQGIASMVALKVDGSGVTQPVSGTFFQATQPVSAASLPLPTGAATAAKQPALGVAGTASTDVISVQGIASMTALKVDGSATTQPVSAASLPLPSGAATSAKQPAIGTAGTASVDVLTVQGKSGMTALVTDGSAVTQPVSAVALPLPSGAATSAKQPALGTAGSASTDVVSVQGIASMTALKVDGSSVTQPVSGTIAEANLDLAQGSTTSGQKGNLIMGAVTTSAPTYVNGQTAPISLDTTGAVRTSGGGSGGGGAVTQSGTWANQLLDAGGVNKATVNSAGSVQTTGAADTEPAAVTMQNNAIAVGNGTSITTTGYGGLLLQVAFGAGNATVAFEAQIVPGSAWVPITGVSSTGLCASSASNTGVSNFNQIWKFDVAGMDTVRARVSSITASSVYVIGQCTPKVSSVDTATVSNLGKTDNSLHSQGAYGVPALAVRADTNAALTTTDGYYSPVAVTASGIVKVQNEASAKATYVATTGQITAASTPTDVVTIYGGAKKIRVLSIKMGYTMSSAGTFTAFLVKRSAADTGGTSTSTTAVPLDSGDAAATASVKQYTANPSGLGAVVGNIRTYRGVVVTNGVSDDTLWDEKLTGKPITLNNSSEGIAVNFNGATTTGLVIGITVIWTEE